MLNHKRKFYLYKHYSPRGFLIPLASGSVEGSAILTIIQQAHSTNISTVTSSMDTVATNHISSQNNNFEMSMSKLWESNITIFTNIV